MTYLGCNADSSHPTPGMLHVIIPRAVLTGAADSFFYQRHVSKVVLREPYRFARHTPRPPTRRARDRSKSAHAFFVGAVRWHQQAIRVRPTYIPIAYNAYHFSHQLRVKCANLAVMVLSIHHACNAGVLQAIMPQPVITGAAGSFLTEYLKSSR
jgi:hypothetical protein